MAGGAGLELGRWYMADRDEREKRRVDHLPVVERIVIAVGGRPCLPLGASGHPRAAYRVVERDAS